MSINSSIEWTESTWNPITGCTKISPGCKNCYAERMAKRLKAMGVDNYFNGFNITLHEHVLDYPIRWKKPQTIFVNSMSDLFHEDVPNSFILKVLDICRRAHWHTFQILTKRSKRLLEIESLVKWPENVWLGVSVENSDFIERVYHLQNTKAIIKFISCEPLIGPISYLPITNIDWVIAGGESGPYSRPISVKWIRNIRDQCVIRGVPFFFKQWGGTNKKKKGRILDGRTWDELPTSNHSLIQSMV